MTILPKDVHTAYALFQVCVIINKKELSPLDCTFVRFRENKTAAAGFLY